MTAHVIYFNYLNADGEGMSIGGIQTYISNLIPVLKGEGLEVVVYQRSTKAFSKEVGGVTVWGVPTEDPYGEQTKKKLFNFAKNRIDAVQDILIFGCESCAVPCPEYRSIAVQHGIFWDVPEHEESQGFSYLLNYIRKCRAAWAIVKRVSLVQKLVCVDYNFINWYRAVVPYTRNKMYVVPNFSAVPKQQPQKLEDGKVRIIFARRFFKHRGTRIFANAMKRVLEKYPQVEVTVAGSGPDAQYVSERLSAFSNVHFITYGSGESMQIHQNQDIALVPTIGSEGTSLSLLEAMASGCAVVCTNVGGMTNIVLDHYNGLMISPDEDSLYTAICELVDDFQLRKRLQDNAYVTVSQSFSLNKWQDKWRLIIKTILQ